MRYPPCKYLCATAFCKTYHAIRARYPKQKQARRSFAILSLKSIVAGASTQTTLGNGRNKKGTQSQTEKNTIKKQERIRWSRVGRRKSKGTCYGTYERERKVELPSLIVYTLLFSHLQSQTPNHAATPTTNSNKRFLNGKFA